VRAPGVAFPRGRRVGCAASTAAEGATAASGGLLRIGAEGQLTSTAPPSSTPAFSTQVPANWTTYPTSRRRDRGTYWYREYRTRQQERRASCCSLWGAALLRGCKRISRKTYPFVRLADACVYLTHPQEQSRSQPLPHTVLSRKNIPYRPTNVCSLRQAPDATTKAAYKRPANHEVSTLLGI
jgi:hypothetical protein